MSEAWKDIPGYEGRYLVSDKGNVMTLGTGVTHKEKRLLKTRLNHGGYVMVALTKNGVTKHYQVHRLVAMSFIPRYGQEELQIDHIDRDRQNNCVDNLRWCTAKENNLNPGTRKAKSLSKTGVLNPNHSSNLNEERRDKLMNAVRVSREKRMKPVERMLDNSVVDSYESSADASASTGVCASNILRCCQGKRKTAGGFEWRFSVKC